MQDLNTAIARSVINGAIGRIAADTALYGDAKAVATANVAMGDLIHNLGRSANADAMRRHLAGKLGELVVATLHGGDIQPIMEVIIAQTARLSPLVEVRAPANETRDEKERETRAEPPFTAGLMGGAI